MAADFPGGGPPHSGADAGKGDARESARETAAQLQEQARAGAERVRHEASRLAGQASERARSMLDEQKSSAADAVHCWADAVRAAARQLQEENRGVAGRYVEQAAEGLDRVSRSMRDQDLETMLHQAEEFARRQPAVFLGGAVALGFVVSRFLKSSAERRRAERGPYYGGAGYGPSTGYGPSAGYAPSTGYDPRTGTYAPGTGPGREPYPASAGSEVRRDTPPPVGGM